MTPESQNTSAEEIDFLDYLNVVIKHRRMILRNALLAGLLTAVVSFLLPKTYTATTTLLPPDDGDSNGLRSLLLNSPTSLLNLPGLPASSSDIFVEILKS
ncbi:MAG: Wzz/FepE/Etk N-terminal domain-containing protein, partial [Anaerolineae bacterium]